jgi:hypothetical protein
LAAVGPASLLSSRAAAGRSQLYLFLLLFGRVGLRLFCCGVAGDRLLFLVLGRLEIVDDPVEEVLYVGVGLC